MCTVLLPPGGYPVAVNQYIISIKLHKLWSKDDDFGIRRTAVVAMVGRLVRSPGAPESKGRKNEYFKYKIVLFPLRLLTFLRQKMKLIFWHRSFTFKF
jgi:hypothetical protein